MTRIRLYERIINALLYIARLRENVAACVETNFESCQQLPKIWPEFADSPIGVFLLYGISMHGQHFLERMREWYNTVLLPLATMNKNVAVTKINIDQLDINQFTPEPSVSSVTSRRLRPE